MRGRLNTRSDVQFIEAARYGCGAGIAWIETEQPKGTVRHVHGLIVGSRVPGYQQKLRIGVRQLLVCGSGTGCGTRTGCELRQTWRRRTFTLRDCPAGRIRVSVDACVCPRFGHPLASGSVKRGKGAEAGDPHLLDFRSFVLRSLWRTASGLPYCFASMSCGIGL